MQETIIAHDSSRYARDSLQHGRQGYLNATKRMQTGRAVAKSIGKKGVNSKALILVHASSCSHELPSARNTGTVNAATMFSHDVT